jgi:hypothetical protein
MQGVTLLKVVVELSVVRLLVESVLDSEVVDIVCTVVVFDVAEVKDEVLRVDVAVSVVLRAQIPQVSSHRCAPAQVGQ